MEEKFDWHPKDTITQKSPDTPKAPSTARSIELTELQEKVFIDRYALRGKDNELLENAPEEMWRRVANVVSSIEQTTEKRKEWEEKFYQALHGFKFVPAGRILKGAGANASLTYYNCFVIPSPEDSRGGIFDSVKLMIEILSRGGGVGVNLSSLRPRGSYVKGVNGTASGAVSFGGLYSYATGLIIQGGSRRGALMLMLNDDHPDIEEFITIKQKMEKVTSANLSVCVSDRFMKAVEEDADWDLKYAGKVYKTIKAKKIWDIICESAWKSGEPGVVFMERYNKMSNTWYFEDIVSVNPCGEQGLPPWGVCNLGSLNLNSMVGEDGAFQFESLKKTIQSALRFLDNVVDVTEYHFEENKKAQKIVRRTGLGTLGLADALIKMGIRYGSKEALEFTEKIYTFIRDEAYRTSIELAKEKGPFPRFVKDKYLQGEFIQKLPSDIQKAIGDYGIRNAVVLTQAPTGTTSLLAGTSSGIEPVYDFAFKRKDRMGEHMVYHPLYQKHLDEHGEENIPDHFVTAKELTPEEHVEMQATVQQYTDSSISKTVNAPNHHTVDDVKTLYMKAYKLGCKGVTYYRDGSRDESVLESIDRKKGKKEKNSQEEQAGQQQLPDISGKFIGPSLSGQIVPRPRPEVVEGTTYKVSTTFGDMFVTINSDQEGIIEVLAQLSRSTDPLNNYTQVMSRLITLALRYGIDAEEVKKSITGVGGSLSEYVRRKAIPSCPDALADIIEQHLEQKHKSQDQKIYADNSVGAAVLSTKKTEKPTTMKQKPEEKIDAKKRKLNAILTGKSEFTGSSSSQMPKGSLCPTCGAELERGEGCMKCHSCGYGLCSV